MKFIHLSDLHIGKRVNEFSMLEDQQYILVKILNAVDQERPDAVLICGDVYDKSVPSADAVQLFDDFLVKLAERKVATFVISGNHDSPERLAFCNRLINLSRIYISPVYEGKVDPIVLSDDLGTVNVYMLPFVKPVNVRKFFPDENVTSYTDAIRVALEGMNVDKSARNVLLTHQFVTGAERSDSEEISVGGLDNVDHEVFKDFDYVALGHIHRPQNISSEHIRYCGTPLKYSFSECDHEKSITVVELQEKGKLKVSTIPLVAKHDMVKLKGTYDQLTFKGFYANTNYQEDYVHITLTDEDDIPDVMAKLRVIYHNLMSISYDNKRTRHIAQLNYSKDVENKSPLQLFGEFYEKQNGVEMTKVQEKFVGELIESIWEGER